MGYGKIFLGLLAGLAAGATLGILFAPDKGTTTRKKITKQSNDYANELGSKVNEFVDEITTKYNKMKRSAAHLIDNGKNQVEESEIFSVPKKNNV